MTRSLLQAFAGFAPMEAEPVDQLPRGAGWQYEPKWDGFRALALREGPSVHLQSRRGRPLGRYFPEVLGALAALPIARFALDGEIVIRRQGFDVLQLRLHPAASRIARLAREHPATFVAFDLLHDSQGQPVLEKPLAERRAALDVFFAHAGKSERLIRSRATRSRAHALKWLRGIGHGLDGIVAKRLDQAYRPGERAMLKFKLQRTYDCVVGGLYLKPGSRRIAYLLLGLYDAYGRLDYVGRAGVGDAEADIRKRLAGLSGRGGFTGRAPGGRSRWSRQARTVTPLAPQSVVEVGADTVTDRMFRHGARLLRWRDDKPPQSCTLDQLPDG